MLYSGGKLKPSGVWGRGADAVSVVDGSDASLLTCGVEAEAAASDVVVGNGVEVKIADSAVAVDGDVGAGVTVSVAPHPPNSKRVRPIPNEDHRRCRRTFRVVFSILSNCGQLQEGGRPVSHGSFPALVIRQYLLNLWFDSRNILLNDIPHNF